MTATVRDPDHELWLRVQDDDADAFALIFDRHVDVVFNFCFRRTADWAAAEDLVSLVFLTAWRRRADIEPLEAGCRPWLLTVANNLARNHARQIRRNRDLLAKLPAREQHVDPTAELAQRLDDQSTLRRIGQAIQQLPRQERDVVALCLLGELNATEAGAALGIAPGTVRSRLSRARQQLRLAAPPGHSSTSSEGEWT